MKRYIGGLCARSGCPLLSEKVVVLILHPKGVYPLIRPYPVTLGLALCSRHAQEVDANDILDEESRQGITHAYAREHNGVLPDLSRVDVASAPLYCEDTQKKLRAAGLRPTHPKQTH